MVESKIKMGMTLLKEMRIKQNDTIFLIGEVRHVYVDEGALLEDGNLNLSAVDGVAISGLETYTEVIRKAHFAFARVGQWPEDDFGG